MINPALLEVLAEFNDTWPPKELKTLTHVSLLTDDLPSELRTALHNLRAALYEMTDRLTELQTAITNTEPNKS